MKLENLSGRLREQLTAHKTGIGNDRLQQWTFLIDSLSSFVDPEANVHAFFVPGRIELLGKHTDYLGGESIVCACSRGIAAISLANESGELALYDLSAGQESHTDLVSGQTDTNRWSLYPQTVTKRLVSDFGQSLSGQTIYFTNSVARSSGLSSSSALVTMIALALIERNGLAGRVFNLVENKRGFAEYLGAVENGRPFRTAQELEGVGTKGGCQDHAAIILGREKTFTRISYNPLGKIGELQLPTGWGIAVGVSGVHARKTGEQKGDYNSLSELSELAWQVVRQKYDSAANSLGEFIRNVEEPPPAAKIFSDEQSVYARRYTHAVGEIRTHIPKAWSGLANGDEKIFSEAAFHSHAAAAELLANQIQETNRLVDIARKLGSMGASAFGAGFGGAVWAIFPEDVVDEKIPAWESEYRSEFPHHNSTFFREVPSSGAMEVDGDSLLNLLPN